MLHFHPPKNLAPTAVCRQLAPGVDLYNRLYRERILFAGAQIDDQLANSMIGVMLYLDSEDAGKPMYMYINSPGGAVTSGFAMFDTMRHIKADVSTINVGLAASMGSFLLMGGTKGKRLALPHSRTMIHQPAMGGFQGQAADVKVEAEQLLAVRKRCVDYYASCCGQPRGQPSPSSTRCDGRPPAAAAEGVVRLSRRSLRRVVHAPGGRRGERRGCQSCRPRRARPWRDRASGRL